MSRKREKKKLVFKMCLNNASNTQSDTETPFDLRSARACAISLRGQKKERGCGRPVLVSREQAHRRVGSAPFAEIRMPLVRH